jgi:hypothetical protein
LPRTAFKIIKSASQSPFQNIRLEVHMIKVNRNFGKTSENGGLLYRKLPFHESCLAWNCYQTLGKRKKIVITKHSAAEV